MEAIREMMGKNKDKGHKSKENDDRSNTGPDTSSAYRSSDASGEPDVGTKSYSRDTGVSKDDLDDRQQNDPNTLTSYASRHGGPTRYSKELSRSGPPGERSATGDSSRSGDNDDDNGGTYSSYSGGVTGASIGDDETGDMGRGVHGSRGMHGSASHAGRSSGVEMSGGNQNYGSYSSTDNYD
ncbi:hypothetical protein F441_13769 [Phytophthora nicotianae CJ01A1]|uniref:Uncharacterized protein n=2 Tax=Phytophthora nicotianae TaxID=4792 RepID=W2WJB7_PHYNI|nr:hypothetical protein F441_13769 [Phytophthora nicotianae CJ01A1]